jgi:hypothetical protein
MKRKILTTAVLFAVLITGIISCDKNKTEKVDPSEKAKKLLELETRMNAINSGNGKMSNFMSVIGYSQLKDGTLNIEGSDSATVYIDSIYTDTTAYWTPMTCAQVSESDNGDGTHTTIYDYGDGCDEYGTLFRGKITYIWKNENNNYYSKVIYENYYSYGVEMNGESDYSFTSDGFSYITVDSTASSGDSTISIEIMPVDFNWSGTSTGHEEITMVYDDGNTISYSSDYSNAWDNNSYKVYVGEYNYVSEVDGYEYHYLVSEPLITDYTCIESWVPVSGVETITTIENEATTVYSLNYGSGNCDNLAELTENGKTSVIDFSELYKTYNSGGDSTVVPMNGRKGHK